MKKEDIYNELSRILTDYEDCNTDAKVTEEDLYEMLVKIQNSWETTITAIEK